MKVLFVLPYAPTRVRVRSYHFLRALVSAGHRVTVATLWSNEEERTAVDGLGDQGIERVVAERLPLGRSAWNCLLALPGREPLQAHFSWSRSLAARLRRLSVEGRFDVIHVEHLRGARYAALVANGPRLTDGERTPVVWDSVDCISTLLRHAARECPLRRVRLAAALELPRTERYESRLLRKFDTVLVTAERDRRDLRELADLRLGPAIRGRNARVEVVPLGIDLDYFSPSPVARQPMSVVVIGKMSYHANVTAVIWLAEKVMPLVRSALPATRLWIVGKDPPPEVRRLGTPWNGDGPDGWTTLGDGRVFVSGTVPDVRPFLRGAALAVAPLRYAVGMQNKVLEALACTTPVVASQAAAESLGAREDDGLIVASEPSDMAATIVTLLGDAKRCARLGQAGRAFVERHHDYRATGARLVEIYRDVAA